MSNENRLKVWYQDQQVGTLWQNQAGLIGFQYEEMWQQNGFAISQQLPVSKTKFLPEENIAHRYFANLLPEANARAHIVRQLKIADSDFNLLKYIGGECAGALSIITADKQPENECTYRLLSAKKVGEIIQQRGQIYTKPLNYKFPRLSLAGAQDKIAVLVEDNSLFLPESNAASSHIIKFEIPEFKNVPLYEFFLMKLADAIGLPTAEVSLETANAHQYLLIKRYDRQIISKNKILRLHQEDFCQGLGISHLNKYQQDGGPSFSQCYALLRKVSSRPIQDIENLLRWHIFNVICGNSDGHAKNIALLYKDKQISLAPFYDLVCTKAIKNIDTNLAISVGGEYNPDKITMSNWIAFAKECGISHRYMAKVILQTTENINNQCAKLYKKLSSTYPALQRVNDVIKKQCKKTFNELATLSNN